MKKKEEKKEIKTSSKEVKNKEEIKNKKKPKVKKVRIYEVKQSEDLIKVDKTLMNKQVEEDENKEKPRKRKNVVINRYNPDGNVGLLKDEVLDRQAVGMVNKVAKKNSKTYPMIFITNLFTIFNVIMLALAVWLVTVRAPITNFIFVGIVVINVVIAIFQEIKAKITIDKLSIVTAPTVTVLRENEYYDIPVDEIVLDDILILRSGKQVPTDCVSISNMPVEVNESLLTGESDAILKKKNDLLYSGSFVVSGEVKAQVISVGKDNYIEKITNQARKYKRPKSELLKSLRILITVLTVLIIPIGILLFYFTSNELGIGVHKYEDTAIKVAGAMIGMVPSGLFLLTSMALAVGVIRLADNNTLVQELYCIEMLARIDTLCLDKTGTITDGSMEVIGIREFKSQASLRLSEVIPEILGHFKTNDPTSKALKERYGIKDQLKVIDDIPFSSTRKYSAVEFEGHGTYILGAPEFVLKDKYSQISMYVEQESIKGYRVLVLCYTKAKIKNNEIASGNTIWPMALISIEDSIRVDAYETIEYFKKSGVSVKVISGDNPITVSRIAERAGIEGYNKYISLENATDNEVVQAANKYNVFGRVSPKQKKILIKEMKKAGHTVAMTGDGVNDILALREADTSIAMASGSDAARNVSHLVLLDSNFSSMPKVVAEGRRVINNVQKVSTLFLTKTIFSVLLSLISIYIALKFKGIYPFSPSQLAPIEFLAIGVPSFFLALEYNNNRISKGNYLFNIIKSSLPGAIAVIINCLLIYLISYNLGFGNFTNPTDQKIVSSLIIITSTAICLMVLYNVAKPLNVVRGILVSAVSIVFILVVFFIPEMFQLTPIVKVGYYAGEPFNPTQLLLLTTLLLGGYPLIYFVQNVLQWTKRATNYILDFFKNYHTDSDENIGEEK